MSQPAPSRSISDMVKDWFVTMPLITRVIMLVCIVLYLVGLIVGQDDQAFCMRPISIYINPLEIYRIVTSAFLHVGLLHIGFNMMAFKPMGSSLERVVGSLSFAYLILLFILLSGVLDLAIAFIGFFVFSYEDFFAQCGIGFSGVLFGLIVVDGSLSTQSHMSVFGLIRVPKKFYPWALLIAIQLIMPGVSFIGHLCGMLAGYLYIFGLLNWITLSSAFVSRMETSPKLNFLTRRSGYITNPAHLNVTGQWAAGDSSSSSSGPSLWSRIRAFFSRGQRQASTGTPQFFSGSGIQLGNIASSRGGYTRVSTEDPDIERGGQESGVDLNNGEKSVINEPDLSTKEPK